MAAMSDHSRSDSSLELLELADYFELQQHINIAQSKPGVTDSVVGIGCVRGLLLSAQSVGLIRGTRELPHNALQPKPTPSNRAFDIYNG